MSLRPWRGMLGASLAGAALLAGAGGVLAASGNTPAVTPSCLKTMKCDGTVSWPSPEGPVTGGSYSPLAQINTSNVKHLKVAWKLMEPTFAGGMEDYPVVVGNVAYLEGPYSTVLAVNATTGKTIWEYKPTTGLFASAYGANSRGVAVGGGRVYLLTKDDHAIALNAATGKPEWNVIVGNAKHSATESAPAFYDNGMVFVGSAGGDSAVRGYELALNAATGKLIWKDYNTPGLGSGWIKNSSQGGGAVWMNPTPGPNGLLYFSTGNPSPDLYGKGRPGSDLWTDSIVAVKAKTGKFVWGHQVIPHDMWDYDSASPPVVFKTAAGWVVGEADKGGYWTEVNALTGQPVTAPEPFVKEDHVAPPMNGKYVLNWPGVLGGSEWSPVSYDPKTQYAYVQGNNIPMLETAKKTDKKAGPMAFVFGTSFATPKGSENVHTGTFSAFDVGSGTLAWQDKTPAPTTGGIVTTAGGIAFGGIDNGVFEAMNASNGKVLWSTNVHTAIGDAPAVYEVNGKEYVLLPIGGSLNFQYSKDGYHAGWIAYALN